MTHPIAETLTRGHSRRHGDCHLGLRTGSTHGDWLSIAALLSEDEHLQATLDRFGIEIGSSRRDVQASIFLEAYAWRLVLPLAGALVAERRVAAPTPHDIALRPGEGRPCELLLRPGRFSALRNDRATAHSDATPARTPTALCEIFEATLIEHCEPIVVALNRRCGRSTRAPWRTIGRGRGRRHDPPSEVPRRLEPERPPPSRCTAVRDLALRNHPGGMLASSQRDAERLTRSIETLERVRDRSGQRSPSAAVDLREQRGETSRSRR